MFLFREPVNGLTHLFAAIAAFFGLIYLILIGWGNPVKVLSLLVYGISLVLLFSASATYHLVKAESKTLVRLRKFDHSAIYLLIAGTYTPICLNMLTGFWKSGLLGIIWGLALLGIGVKIFFIRAPRWFTAAVYVVMGWLSILGVKGLITRLPGGALGWRDYLHPGSGDLQHQTVQFRPQSLWLSRGLAYICYYRGHGALYSDCRVYCASLNCPGFSCMWGRAYFQLFLSRKRPDFNQKT